MGCRKRSSRPLENSHISDLEQNLLELNRVYLFSPSVSSIWNLNVWYYPPCYLGKYLNLN
jgi:hypothetical protein